MLPLALIAFGLAAPPELPEVVSAKPDVELNAKFRRTQGWVGADGAYSVPISETKALWLFSDTFVGSIRDGKRSGVVMVNNTIGIQDGRGSDAKLAFAIRRTGKKAEAILAPTDGKGWFWLQAGVHIEGTLFLFLPRIEKTNAGGAFGFNHVDQWLGTIANPDAEPTEWKAKYVKLPFADLASERKVSFGAAVLRDGEHLYVYGYEERPAKPFPGRKMLVARVPIAKIADFDAWRFFSHGEWKPDVKDASPAFGELATEYSVSFVPGLKRFVAVYTENGLGDRVLGRFADSPVGPWSEPLLLYRCPEMKANKKLFSYAAKAHPHLAAEREIVLTYCVNSFEFAPVIDDATLYWPNFVRVKLK